MTERERELAELDFLWEASCQVDFASSSTGVLHVCSTHKSTVREARGGFAEAVRSTVLKASFSLPHSSAGQIIQVSV